MLGMLIPIGLIVVFIFFSSRSRKKQERQDAEMRDSLAVGDEVTTIGGIIGMVVSVKGETFVLETTKDKTKIRFLKGAIRSVDVKAADRAAAILETKEAADEAPVEAAAEIDAPKAEKKSKKSKKQADAPVEAAPAEEAPAEEK
jgi:preprotein translocase subunit YajC